MESTFYLHEVAQVLEIDAPNDVQGCMKDFNRNAITNIYTGDLR